MPGGMAVVVFWVPAIAISGLSFYDGDKFPQWKGNAFVGAMRANTGQHIQRVQFNPKGLPTGREILLAELKQRIARTIDFILSVPAEKVDGSEDRQVTLLRGGKEVTYTGSQYLLGYAYPNFYFHVTTAYDILRVNGVDLGKKDYIGSP